MEKVVVYGLGKRWGQYRSFIAQHYKIIACSDRDISKKESCESIPFVNLEGIQNQKFDYVIVTPNDYQILDTLIQQYNIPYESIRFLGDILSKKKKFESQGKRYDVELTVIIPTYNRFERLVRTLKLLDQQSDSNFKVKIVDNDSEYNVDDVLCNVSIDLRDRTTVYKNNVNIGMNGNLSKIFTYAEDGWIWTLSDDDLLETDAVEIIKSTIVDNPSAEIFMFSLSNISLALGEKQSELFDSLDGLAEFYNKFNVDCWDWLYSGDFFYISNKVYSAKMCKRYVTEIIKNAYSGIPQVYPIFGMLSENAGGFVISNYKIVNHARNAEATWNLYETALGMSTVVDWPIIVKEENRAILYRLCSLEHTTIMTDKKEDLTERQVSIAKTLYERVYSLFMNEKEKEEFLNWLRF